MKNRPYFRQQKFKKGQIFSGEELTIDQTFVMAFFRGNSVKKFVSELTDEEKALVVKCLRRIKTLEVRENLYEDFDNSFEHPIGSGNKFSVSQTEYSKYNALLLQKGKLKYPFDYATGNGNVIDFKSPEELENFVNAAFAHQQTLYNDKLMPLLKGIRDVKMEDGDIVSFIDKINLVDVQ